MHRVLMSRVCLPAGLGVHTPVWVQRVDVHPGPGCVVVRWLQGVFFHPGSVCLLAGVREAVPGGLAGVGGCTLGAGGCVGEESVSAPQVRVCVRVLRGHPHCQGLVGGLAGCLWVVVSVCPHRAVGCPPCGCNGETEARGVMSLPSRGGGADCAPAVVSPWWCGVRSRGCCAGVWV